MRITPFYTSPDIKIKEPVPFGTTKLHYGINPIKQVGSCSWFIRFYTAPTIPIRDIFEHKLQAIPARSRKTGVRYFISPAAARAITDGRKIGLDKVSIFTLGRDFIYVEREAYITTNSLEQLGLPSAKEIVEQLTPLQKRIIFAVHIMIKEYFLSQENRSVALEIAHQQIKDTGPDPFEFIGQNDETQEIAARITNSVLQTFFCVLIFYKDWFNDIINETFAGLDNADECAAEIQAIEDWVNSL